MTTASNRFAVVSFLIAALSACSSSSDPVTYAVGGSLSGLPASSTIVLRNDGGDDLTLSANGAFTFATRLPSGAAYAVTLHSSPAGQTCTVTGGAGTVGASDVTSIQVACVPTTYSIGGTLSGLPASSSIVLQNNGGDDLTVSADGPFTFATRLVSGAAYAVTVQTAPAGQTCTVTGGTGAVAAGPVNTVAVACAPTTYSIGGTLAGLPASSSIVLRNNGGDDLTVAANGPFAFATKLLDGAAYAVTILTQPAGQTCTVTGGSGAVAGGPVNTVAIACVPTTYSIGGTLSGLPASATVVLRNNGGDDLTLAANGLFAFATKLLDGAAYAVTILTQPAGQTCTVTGGSGAVAGGPVNTVAVACAPTTYSIGGLLAGLPAASSIVLQNNGGDDLTLSTNGPFTFATKLLDGAAYAVTVRTPPVGQTCTVTGGSGVVAGDHVTTVAVACVPSTYSIGGTLSGLPASATIVLRNNGGDDLTLSANGPFAFATKLLDGAAYAVTVQTPPAGQTCAVTGGTGTVTGGPVDTVAVACATTTYAIGGVAAGVTANGLVLHSTVGNEDLPVPTGATSFTFSNRAASGTAYTVTIKASPAGLTCTLANASGTVTGQVGDISVTCSSTLQAWSAPTTWGGFWADGPTMLQHAHFDVSGMVSDKGPTFVMVGGAEPTPFALNGIPTGTRYGGGPFPQEAVNYRAAGADILDLPGRLLVCAIVKPTRNRPFDSYESPIIAKGVGDGKYTVNHGGWVLMQMHESWCFHYEYLDGNGVTHQFMSSIPNLFADQDFEQNMSPPLPLPDFQPDASYVVVCGGRDGDDIVVAANTLDASSAARFNLGLTVDELPSPFPGPYTLDAAPTVPATIGGYHLTQAQLRASSAPPTDANAFATGQHSFKGYVFETAVWDEPASPANIAAKMASFFATTRSETYLRNREAAFVDGSGRLHLASRHAPRVDPSRGYLFGLQSWNRVSYWGDGNAQFRRPLVFAAGENLLQPEVWARTPASGGGAPAVILDPTVHPPNDSPLTSGQRVTLPPNASLSLALDRALPPLPDPPNPTPNLHNRKTWDTSGPILGQVWLAPVSSGTLRLQKTSPMPGHGSSCTVLGVPGTTCESRDVDLGALAPGQWSRVSLNGAFTADARTSGGVTVNPGTLVLTNPGSSSVTFYAWGVQLTQIGGGGDLGAFDPAELMYDWSASRAPGGEPSDDPFYPIDVLKLSPVPVSTAATGYCLGAEATMPAGLAWNAPFPTARTAVAWLNSLTAPTRTARIYVKGDDGTPDAGKLCFDLTDAAVPACAAVPAGWSSDGAKHSVKGCMSPVGQLRLYGDDVQLAEGTAGISRPDLVGGTVLVGNGDFRPVSGLTPWHGYVSRAMVCRDTGNAADCR